MLKIGIIGASGYTGAELIRLLHRHPQIAITQMSAESNAHQPVASVFPHLAAIKLPELLSLEEIDFSELDVAFFCLPHGTTQTEIAKLAPRLQSGKLKLIDLSADFRLSDPASYAEWYGHAHQAVDLQTQAVYGLTEHFRKEIKQASLVANPGCYPTSVQLPLVPLLKEKLIDSDSIIIDSKSGTTGAGRKAVQAQLFAEVNEGISPYGIGKHRHMPEIDQGLSIAAGKAVSATFTPHLMPMSRGILSTIYVKLTKGASVDALRASLENTYREEYFVKLLAKGAAPSTHQVRGTNYCFMNVFADRGEDRAIIVSAIDNLVKGASGQAVQNMNLMVGFDEPMGLEALALVP